MAEFEVETSNSKFGCLGDLLLIGSVVGIAVQVGSWGWDLANQSLKAYATLSPINKPLSDGQITVYNKLGETQKLLRSRSSPLSQNPQDIYSLERHPSRVILLKAVDEPSASEAESALKEMCQVQNRWEINLDNQTIARLYLVEDDNCLQR